MKNICDVNLLKNRERMSEIELALFYERPRIIHSCEDIFGTL